MSSTMSGKGRPSAMGRGFCSLAILSIAACGTLIGNPKQPGGGGTSGGVTFALTDAPVDDVASVLIVVSSLEARQADGKWQTIEITNSDPIDLLALQNGITETFASAPGLPAGRYTELRLVLSKDYEPRVTLPDGSEEMLAVPSGTSSGIKIKGAFTVAEGEGSEVIIDFDLRRSLKERVPGDVDFAKQRFTLQPVLRFIDKAESGDLEGETTDGDIICVYREGVEPDDTSDCPNADGTTTAQNGRYKVSYLPETGYQVRIFSRDSSVKSNKKVHVKKR